MGVIFYQDIPACSKVWGDYSTIKTSTSPQTITELLDSRCTFSDLTQDGAGDCNLSLLQEGKLSLHIKLSAALRESATIVVYLEKEGLIEIDKDRTVSFEN